MMQQPLAFFTTWSASFEALPAPASMSWRVKKERKEGTNKK
jgi:hypothetical protein